MIIKEPYKSKTLQYQNVQTAIDHVNRYITIDYAYIKQNSRIQVKPQEAMDSTINTVILYGISDSEKEIIPINHPLFSPIHKWGCLDLRNQVTVNPATRDYEVKNESEYRLSLLRYALSLSWYADNQSSLYSLELAHFTFATLISDNLSSKFGLDLGDKVMLRTLAAIYYVKLFSNETDSDEKDKLKIRTKKDLLVPEIIDEIYELVPNMRTIDDFCEACYTVTKNVRLKGLDYTVLSNIMSSNWLGGNGKELILLCLEHPPTWIAMVYSSLTQRSFKRSYVTTVVEKQAKRGKDVEFIKQVDAMVKDIIEEGF